MVNLVTGNLSYVLPLLNVPSPEGGYPIALSYHAGIAMDQEASWVGLGWNLNPGAINRNVNGYPDDWGKTNFSEFFYDKGWDENYYSFSAGVTFNGKISVGLGLSWGSNQSLGGHVSVSIGLGGSGASIGGYTGTNGVGVTGGYGRFKGSLGTNGASVTGGYGGFYGSLGTDGVGIGYGTTKGSTSFGVNLNYNYNSGLSGGINVGTKSSGIGISFNSNGASVNVKTNGFGAGISSSAGSIDAGDYDVTVTSSGFFLPIYIFYVGYNHTNVKYSLFKYNSLNTSGMLYPVEANKNRHYRSPDSHRLSRWMEENHFMDVNTIQRFGKNSAYSVLIDNARKNDRNNLILPNYDNYSVSAQGISGTISPYNHVDLILSARGRGEQNNDNEYVHYLNYDISEYKAAPSTGIANGPGFDAVRKKYFTFSSAYNSFLRLKTSDIYREANLPSVLHSSHIMKFFKTRKTNTYNNLYSISNNDQRKKEGNTIITYTNKEIRRGNLTGYIDAKQGGDFLNRKDAKVFLDEGIGAFQITALDGKTYHYSLPVYQFESVYKNFKYANDEDKNFLEIEKDKPYATHWLLTGITGPDYVDVNNDKKLDKGDYGYWVEFDYGKWSDGYIWQTPNGRIEENIDIKNSNNKTYSYLWGRKQVYYLDAIKTRTHTALFIKEIRNDNVSVRKNFNNFFESAKVKEHFFPGDKVYIDVTDVSSVWMDDIQGVLTNQLTSSGGWNYIADGYGLAGDIKSISGVKHVENDIDIPLTKTLSLSKVYLLKNSVLPLIDKSLSSYSFEQSGKYLKEIYVGGLKGIRVNTSSIRDEIIGVYPDVYTYDPQTREKNFSTNLHQNILDAKDVAGLGLEGKASQIIDFNYDYSLAKNAPNTSSGRLTLKNVTFKGKKGVQTVPPYKFSYKDTNVSYNKDNIDAWGYHKDNPALWSLNEITTPIGGKIKIDYEKDVYGEAAYGEEKVFSDISSTVNNGTKVRVNFGSGSPIASEYFNIGIYYKITFNITRYEEGYYDAAYDDTFRTQGTYPVSSVGANWVEFETSRTDTKLHLFNDSSNCVRQDDCIDNLKVYGAAHGQSTSIDGGGIRTQSITINDGVKDIATTEYKYLNGITSYAPSKGQKGVPYASELPAPLVMYGSVEMQTKDGADRYLGKTVYEFETLKPRQQENGYIFSLGECFRVKENQNTTFEKGQVIANKYTIESRLGNIGRVNSMKSYNSLGQLMRQVKNKYKQNLDGRGEIGVTQETHSSYKLVEKNGVKKFYVSSTSKVNYPSVLESVTETSGGLSVTKRFNKYDFLTGQVLETTTFASDGTAFKTKAVPAYTRYSNMGSKVDNIRNKNMLTQSAANYTYLLDIDGNEKVIGANITTWNNKWSYRSHTGVEPASNREVPVWRKHKTYLWKGDIARDGTYIGFNEVNDDGFNWGIGVSQSNTKWQIISETTRYNHYSSPLEIKDVNGNYAATKMGDSDSKVLATANSSYIDMYYSGAEYRSPNSYYYFDGEIASLGQKPSTTAHTGKYVISISSGQKAFEVNIPSNPSRDTAIKQRFKISVWVRTSQKDNIKFNSNGVLYNFNSEETIIAGGWALLNGYVKIPETGANIYIRSTNGRVQLDDFRLHPVTSSMISYVYNDWDEVSYITKANGLSTHYKYDEAGRLKETWVEVENNDEAGIIGGFKKVKEYGYTYKGVAKIDVNGNGIIDGAEGYEPINIYLRRTSPYTNTGVIVSVSGGSGDFSYRYAKGIVSGPLASGQVSNLRYGYYTTVNNINVFRVPCNPNYENEYESYVVKVMVKDNRTGLIKEQIGYYNRSCNNNGPRPLTPR